MIKSGIVMLFFIIKEKNRFYRLKKIILVINLSKKKFSKQKFNKTSEMKWNQIGLVYYFIVAP